MLGKIRALRAISTAMALEACTLLAAPAADVILKNGSIYSVDAARSWAQAVAIAGSKIVYAGNDAGASAFAGPSTKIINPKRCN